MPSTSASDPGLLCPSARPEMAASELFAVVSGSVDQPLAAYLTNTLQVTPELLAMTGPVEPMEVFRFAAPCVGHACVHFDGAQCSLAKRVAQYMPAVVDRLPACPIRPRCRWFREQGGVACKACPAIVSKDYRAVPLIRGVALGKDQLAQGGA